MTHPCGQMLDVNGDGLLDLNAPLCGEPSVVSVLTRGGTVDLCAEHAYCLRCHRQLSDGEFGGRCADCEMGS